LRAKYLLQIENESIRAAAMLFSSAITARFVSLRDDAHAPANAPKAAVMIVPMK
jgi:hypothetical protein